MINMEKTIEIGGKEYDDKQIREVVQVVNKIWMAIKDAIYQAIQYAADVINRVTNLIQQPPVGLKKHFKQNELKEYNRLSTYKSNNWRARQGLPLRRNLKYK